MKAYELQGEFGLANVRLVDRPEPHPGPQEALVEVKANSLNFRDWLMVEGRYNPKQRLPLVPLSDGAGIIRELGPGAERFRVGTRVAAAFAPGWVSGEMTRAKFKTALGGPNDGLLCERIVVPEDGLVEIPAHLSFEEAATLPAAAVTAFNALVTEGKTAPGDVIVVQGTGGVSLFAVQFAQLCGARVILTSSSNEKLARAAAMAPDCIIECINRNTRPDWAKRVRELTGGRGADHVVDVAGAASFNESVRATRMGGTVSVIGQLSGGAGEINLIPLLMQNIRVQGVTVGSRELFEQMNRAIVAANLRPVVDRVFPFEEAKEALLYLSQGAHFGKICIGRGAGRSGQ